MESRSRASAASRRSRLEEISNRQKISCTLNSARGPHSELGYSTCVETCQRKNLEYIPLLKLDVDLHA